MSESRNGQVVTFYSYKGGTGRTMALANVAWILASAGKRVLVADWDLEAPGLHRFFTPFLKVENVGHMPGVIDLVRAYEEQVRREAMRPDDWVAEVARVESYAFSLDWTFDRGGSLDLLSAGRQNGAYASTLGSLDWDDFYDNLAGGVFLDALREDMRRSYDYTLIDSRTGFSDVADICTQHLPDTLVDCFTLSDQGIDGAARVARAVATFSKKNGPYRRIRILPVAMRVDQGEKEKADAGRLLAMRSFPSLPTGMSEQERVRYFASVEVPYLAFYAYEETLATFGDKPGSPTSLLAAYERLTDVITDGAVTALTPMDESVRNRWRLSFERPLLPEQTLIRLRYVAEDQTWAEWVGDVLRTAGITVLDDGPMEAVASERVSSSGAAELSIVSGRFAAQQELAETPNRWEDPSQLLLFVEDLWLREVPKEARTSVVSLDEAEATEQLLKLVGKTETTARAERPAVARFPGSEPRWFRVPVRNQRFTGRDVELQLLRRELRSSGSATVLPVALEGRGGVGKTQLALEYAYRFRLAYDLVWWFGADPPQFLDTALADLGVELELPSEGAAVEQARVTLDALDRGEPTQRWLLIFDNADDIDKLREFIPSGDGHVLITSRKPGWAERANPIQVDVFRREESVAHLRGRHPAITVDQASEVARALRDLPIAVAAAGAWLAENKTPVTDYLDALKQHGASGRIEETALDLTLDRLMGQSPGAYRLLQICSVLGPEIALDLLYSNQLTSALVPFDPSVTVGDQRSTLVQQVNRLALIKMDARAGQVQVHRLLQEVLRDRMTALELAQTKHEAHLALARFRPVGEPDDPETWGRFRQIWPHLEVSGAVSCDDESVRQLLIDRVRYLWRRGDFPQGMELGNQVSDAWEKVLKTNPETGEPLEAGSDTNSLLRQLLHLRFNIANILRDEAKYESAMRLDEEVLAAQRVLLGARHAHALRTSGGLAADLRALGRYAEALPLEEATYAVWLEDFGEDHPRALAAANNLAVSLRAVGNFRRALRIDEDVWERRRIVLGAVHPYTLHSQSSVGRDLREAGEYEQSVGVLRTVHSLSRQHLGSESVGTLNAQSNLAASLRSAGHADEAVDLLEESYEKLRVRFGADNPNTLACRQNRSANLLATGETAKALEEMRAVAESYQKARGSDHPFSLVCVSNLSAAWRQHGELDRAAALAVRAVEGSGALLGTSHPYYFAAAMNCATCRYEGGEIGLAIEDMTVLAEQMARRLGSAHPDAIVCRGNLGLFEVAHSRSRSEGTGSADGALTTTIADLATRLGSNHPAVESLRAGEPVYRVIDPQDPF